ncbi:MAG: hypothetical protein HUU18_01680 [Phycisphaerales bacterium]|nr:hypothetical protein [Phycisphaerales bacterium]
MRAKLIGMALIVLAGSVAQAQPYTFGGIPAGGGGWTWNQSGMLGFRSALTNPANFGPAGVVGTSVATVSIPSISAANLATIDCFVAPANHDSAYIPADIVAITAWFMAGGDLLLLNDGADYDMIASSLGVPTQGTGGAQTIGVGPVGFTGPFGNVNAINNSGLIGTLNPINVASTGGQVMGTNGGAPSVAFWDRGAFGPNSGRMIIVCDVDAIATNVGYPGQADYAAMNANAIFALNVAAAFVPTPGSLSLLGVASLAALRRRR